MYNFIEKKGTHIVLKVEDLNNALDNDQKLQFEKIVSFVGGYRRAKNKNPHPTYIVVNSDEPYFHMIVDALKEGEKLKRGGSDFK